MTLEPPARVDEPDATSPEANVPTSRRPGRRWIAIGLIVALVAAGCYWLWQTNTADADNDGLTNKVETSGWQTQDGTLYRTDPYQADTDSDGLTDADEAGALVTAAGTGDVYAGYSHPLVRDTDEDGLPDGGEADPGLDPRDRDMDDDELSDGYEVDVAGTEPANADPDGAGLADRDDLGDRLVSDGERAGEDPEARHDRVEVAAGDRERADDHAGGVRGLGVGGLGIDLGAGSDLRRRDEDVGAVLVDEGLGVDAELLHRAGLEPLDPHPLLRARHLVAVHRRGQRLELGPVSYTHLRAPETVLDLVCRLLLGKKKIKNKKKPNT